MTTHIVLLRGINVGGHNRLPMPALREVLEGLGYARVRTLLQSGNALVDSDESAATLARRVHDAIELDLKLDLPIITRTAAQLAQVVAADPLGSVATVGKFYNCWFLSGKPGADVLDDIDLQAFAPSTCTIVGHELYTWTPAGMHADRLVRTLSERRLGVTATARNWNTVVKLHELARDNS